MGTGFPAGLTIGVILTLGMIWLLDPDLGPIIEQESVSFFAISATLLAAAIAYSGVQRQIRHQDEREEKRRSRELDAERAMLPLALSRVCEISRRGMQDTVGHSNVDGALAREDLNLEELFLESFKAMIKISEPTVSKQLQAILVGYQVASASIDWKFDSELSIAPAEQSLDGYNRISLCYRWALLHALAESLFEFARGGSAPIHYSLPRDRLLSAVRFADIHPGRFTDFEGFFERAMERDGQKSLDNLFRH